jgi:hypothetical protein
MTMTVELVTDDQMLEGRFLSDHVPAVGDRIVFCESLYEVTGRTWRIEEGRVELRVTKL